VSNYLSAVEIDLVAECCKRRKAIRWIRLLAYRI